MNFTRNDQSSSSGGGASSSCSSSTSSLTMTPLFSRRASYSSNASTSDSSEDELETPNSSPQLFGQDANQSHAGGGGKGKGKATSIDHDILPFSLLEINENEDATTSPSSSSSASARFPIPNLNLIPTSASEPTVHQTSTPPSTLVYPPGLPIPASHSRSLHQSTPSPLSPETSSSRPRPPSRSQEENARGRSRWPRILWSSELDHESINVLRSYHERVVGGDLPVLKPGMTKREVGRWSRRMEDAGL